MRPAICALVRLPASVRETNLTTPPLFVSTDFLTAAKLYLGDRSSDLPIALNAAKMPRTRWMGRVGDD